MFETVQDANDIPIAVLLGGGHQVIIISIHSCLLHVLINLCRLMMLKQQQLQFFNCVTLDCQN